MTVLDARDFEVPPMNNLKPPVKLLRYIKNKIVALNSSNVDIIETNLSHKELQEKWRQNQALTTHSLSLDSTKTAPDSTNIAMTITQKNQASKKMIN